MKQMTRTLLAVSMLLSTVQLSATTSGLSYFLPRAQNGTAVDLLGWMPFVHKYDADAMYFDFKVQSEWRQSFNSTKLGEYIFFNGTNSMIWGNANTAGTTAPTTNVNGINFLLPAGTNITATVDPKIQSSITDFSLYVGLDEFVSGLYFFVHLPLVYTRWNTHLENTVNTAAPTTFAAGEVSTAAGTAAPYTDVVAAFKGNKTAGDASVTWKYGTINGSQNETKLGDVALTFGYDFISKENAHLSLAIRGLFGAGGKSKAQYVFEPTVGMGGRSGVGGYLDGHVRLWERDEDHNLALYVTGYAVHLFNGTELRSYDLTTSGTGSRYNLVKKLTALTGVGNTFVNLDNMINIGTQHAKINVNVTYEANIQLSYNMGNVGFDLGYSAGGHGSESFSSWVDTIPANTYVLYGTSGANDSAPNQTTGISQITVSGNQTGATTAVVTTANQSTYCISNASLNQASALAPSVFSNIIFFDVNYTWRDNDWSPNVSLFGSAEFGGSNKTPNTWSVGLQGNVSY